MQLNTNLHDVSENNFLKSIYKLSIYKLFIQTIYVSTNNQLLKLEIN